MTLVTGMQPPTRRSVLKHFGGALAALISLRPTVAKAVDDILVPAAVLARLLMKVVLYQRNTPARPAGTFRTLLLARKGDVDSRQAAQQLARALGAMSKIALLPHQEFVEDYTTPATFAKFCKDHNIGMVYLSSNLGDHIAAIVGELKGSHILTVTAVSKYLFKGVAIGMDLVSGQTQLLVNHNALKAQDVDINPGLLGIMKVVK